ncbi:MAG TPA: PriCT-2 domain-containing protein, partial [Saprospiraceae bacterium]|nr:PriCT-2 domain-containing protein [Saprospiraceae bacterium]
MPLGKIKKDPGWKSFGKDLKKMSKKSCSNSLMEYEIVASIQQYRVKKGEPFTHTTKDPSGSYYIGEDAYESFITNYCNKIRKGARPTVTEKPGAYGPLRVDFDFRSSLDVGTHRQYDLDILKEIVKLYQIEIKAAIDKEEFIDKMLWCIVLEKKAPRVEDGKIKDGFHLHFPYFICEGWFQDEFLREKVTRRMIEENIWKGKKFIEPVDKFIDIHMARKQWLMYGSAKKNGAEPFLVTKAFDENLEELSLTEIFQIQLKGKKLPVQYYLPRFMSIRNHNEQTPLNNEMEVRRVAYRTKKTRKNIIIKKRSIEEVLEDIKVIKDGEIMSMLSDDRAETFETWMDVGWTLFNIGQGCDEALDLWIEFSKRSEKFVEGDCEERWSKMEMKGKTMGSLLSMAKSDNPNHFKEWKDANVKTFLYKSLIERKPTEWDMAQVVHKLYKDRFLCADSKKDVWYEFINHKWQYMDDGVTLKKLFATEIVELYYGLKAELAAASSAAANDEAKRTRCDSQIKKCDEIITSLKTCRFHSNLMKMCNILFHDTLFVKKMDENKMLFVCENGVLDLEMGIFRDGRPDDYMTFSCNIPYHKYSKDDDEWKDLKMLLRKVFTNKNRRSYFKDIACAAMEGGNVNKQFVIGTGGGDNAKTITFNLLELTFGDYAMKFPREMLIKGNSKNSSGARPELARVRGKRMVVIQEVAKDETLSIGVIKEYTGNDSFFARGLYEKGTEIKPMFTLFMCCNEPPQIPGHDDATWNRVRILDYDSKFVKPSDLEKCPVPESEEEQFKMKRFKADPHFGKKLPEMALVMLSYLFERFKKYKKRGLKEPPEVQMATTIYRSMNDVYLQFIQDRLEEVVYPKSTKDSEKEFLKLAELHVEFTAWYQETHTSYSREKFNRVSLKHEFNKKLKNSGKKGNADG